MPHRGLERQIGRGVTQGLGGAQAGFAQAPSIGGIGALLQQLLGERGGLMGQLQGLRGFPTATPQIQALAQQAAFAPVEGMQPFLQQALLQAHQGAASRGLGQSTIAGALQAQAIPQIMGPALAEARGRQAQLMLELPLQARQLEFQRLGLGGELIGLGGQLGQQQLGVRESAFNQLQSAIQSAQAEREHRQQRHGGFGRALGAIGGMALGSFLGPIGTQVGGALGGRLGGLLGGGDGGGTRNLFQFGQPRGTGPFAPAGMPQIGPDIGIRPDFTGNLAQSFRGAGGFFGF